MDDFKRPLTTWELASILYGDEQTLGTEAERPPRTPGLGLRDAGKQIRASYRDPPVLQH